MYVDTLKFYITNLLEKNSSQKIVFVDNSGWDLDSVKSKLPTYDESSIEFISLDADKFDVSKGKGYNELILIREAVERSKIIASAGAFMKVTGRYPVLNIGRLLSDASKAIFVKHKTLYCDIKDHKLYDWLRLGWNGHTLDCRVFAVDAARFINDIAPLYVKCNDYQPGNYIEDVMYRYVKQNPHDTTVRFKREPHFGGVEGSAPQSIFASSDQRSFKAEFKRFVGNAIRIVTPWFYF